MWDSAELFPLVLVIAIGVFLFGSFVGYIARGGSGISYRRPRAYRFRHVRFLVAICLGVAGTLAWQSYGDATKQIIATRAPELGWSPEAKQMIVSSIHWLGWAKQPPAPEITAAETVAPTAGRQPAEGQSPPR
jgi:hypothetical protein